MKYFLSLSFTYLLFTACYSQSENKPRLVGGPCEGCEAILEKSPESLLSSDTLPDFGKGYTDIKIEGTVYQANGQTPAPNVILYVYHTDANGIYKPSSNPVGLEKRHGYNRTWLKTDENGKYSYFTIKPASYPNSREPAHIHYTILEPNGKYYWLESVHFTGDPNLSHRQISPSSPRGGSSGLVELKADGDILVGRKDIVLGKNVNNYN